VQVWRCAETGEAPRGQGASAGTPKRVTAGWSAGTPASNFSMTYRWRRLLETTRAAPAIVRSLRLEGEHLIRNDGSILIKVDPSRGSNNMALGTQQVPIRTASKSISIKQQMRCCSGARATLKVNRVM
jgi:hypothetical protein